MNKELKDNLRKNKYKEIWRHREIYLFLLPAVISVILFKYVPMYGTIMAFQDVKIGSAFGQNDWVGLKHFLRLFRSSWFPTMMWNTAAVSILQNILCWPFPIFLAIILHNATAKRIKKIAQMSSYLPHLLSLVIVVSIINVFCAGESGLINIVLQKLGHERINFFGDPDWVWPLYIVSGVWKETGYSAIVYLGALSSVDEALEEAARIDGAGKLQVIRHIQLPTIVPSMATMLILNVGKAFSLGADKMLLLQTNLNLERSEIIATYVYKTGIAGAQYGFSTAAGLFQSLINLGMLILVNTIVKKMTDVSVV